MQGDEAATPPFELDADTMLVPDSEGERGSGGGPRRWRCELTDRWTVASGLNGGYIGAVLVRAAIAASTHPEPLAMTAHYLERPAPGAAWLDVDLLRQGRNHTTVEVRLIQGDPGQGDEGEERGGVDNTRAVVKAAATVTLGRRRQPGASDFQAPPPSLPPPDQCEEAPQLTIEGATLRERVRYRVAPGLGGFFGFDPLRSPAGDGSRVALVQGWIRLADGRPADAIAVPLFLDCWPPAVFGRVDRAFGGGVPTIELTVHWRGDPGEGWQLARFTTGNLTGGYLEEDGALWSEDGRLVAMSRQLALFIEAPRFAAPPA